MLYLSGYLGLACLVSFVLCGVDKRRAQRHRWRISEKALLLSAGLGGAWGFWLGMGVFHHKTKHLAFQILVPLFSVLWAGISIVLLWKFA